MIHDLKTHQPFFDAVAEGRKTFEVRKNDRGYQVGDTLILRMYDPETKQYMSVDGGLKTNASKAARLDVRVTYVLSGWGIEPGYVCMGIEVRP